MSEIVDLGTLTELASREIKFEKQAAPTTHPSSLGAVNSLQASDQKAQTDSRYVDVSNIVPTRCAVYASKTLSIRPFAPLEIQKLHRAIVEQASRHEVDALSACISPITAYDLTVGDARWLMYWERINSYKKMPFQKKWRCSNPEHMGRIGNGELSSESLDNLSTITNSHLKEIPLDLNEANRFAEEFHRQYDVFLDIPRMGDLVEDEESKGSKDDMWFNKYASCINRLKYGATLAQRRSYVKSWFNHLTSPDVVEDLERWIKIIEHDVVEIIEVTCKECGASERVEMLISPLNFLPGNQL